MRQFKTIFKYEFKNYLTNKVFVGVTLALIILLGGITFIPRLIGSDDADSTVNIADMPVMLVSCNTVEAGNLDSDIVKTIFAETFKDYNIVVTEENVEAIKEKITSKEAECAFVLDSYTSYTYYVDNLSLYDTNAETARQVFQNMYRMSAMITEGISPEAAQNIMSVQIEYETQSLGKDQVQNFFYTYIMIFALYMVILLYGQMVASSVASEKSSRAMELLVTSANPTSMMFGKVLSSCLAGLLQLAAIFGTVIVCFNINKTYWDSDGIMAAFFNIPTELLVYMLVFFVLGFLVYAFLYGATGSVVSKLEDLNTAVMPVTLLFIAGFMIVIMTMSSGNTDTLLLKVASYVPFTSPMAMFTRIAMSRVAAYEIAISIAILAVSVVLVGVIAAKIYRMGVLLYGKRPSIGTIISTLRKEKTRR